MSISKFKLHLVQNKHLKIITRYASKDCDKKNKKSEVCDKTKPCTKPNIETDGVIQEKKDICVYSPCPKEPCPIEPCVPDIAAQGSIIPEEGVPGKKDVSIIVIGAGIAGLSCAQRLVTAGFRKTIILEAEDRPGGRIHSDYLNDAVIEKGRDWCEEMTNPFRNHILQLGVKNRLFNIPLSGVDPSQGLLLGTDCTPLPLPISFMAYNHISEIIKQVECIRTKVPPTQSDLMDSYIGVRLNQLLKRLPPNMAVTAARILLGLKSYLSPSMRKVVSDSFGAFATGASFRIPLGSLGALAPIITDISPERIFYSKQVLNIRWGTVIPEQHPRAVVKCRDGSVYNGEYVVITCPLGVLKNYMKTMFCPPLSPAKTEAILSLNVGHFGKIFLEYKQPFWIWRENRIHQQWNYDELSKRNDFTRGMIALEEVPGSEFVLVAKIRGSAVEEMEKLTDVEVADHLTAFLKEWTGDNCIPNPNTLIRTKWATNNNFQGFYTCSGDETEDPCLTEAIKSPLPQGCSELPPILYFAGEHTCQDDLKGTVKGAMISGIREAERVIDAIRHATYESPACELVATS